jgi:hypothetical protein
MARRRPSSRKRSLGGRGPGPRYRDVPGLCKAATLAEIEAQGWSLNPGRYVGVAPGEDVSDEDFKEQLETLNEELESLNAQARELDRHEPGVTMATDECPWLGNYVKDFRVVGEVLQPPLPVQQRIAGILSAYDELIENSLRRIKILESMARALYREWFVHFRFPGHENHPRVTSPLGEIPQGWEVKNLSAVAEVNRAQINARSAPEELHYIDISSVSPGQIDSITTYAFADAPGRARRIVQHGDVLWSCVRPNRRSHAQVMHPESDTIASTGFAVLTATRVPFTFLYFATTTDDFVAYLTNNATGAAYPAVTAPTFEKADLLVPSAALLKKFGDATIPMAEEIHTLQRQIHNLRRTRDLLLPRLLSGQIEVEVA